MQEIIPLFKYASETPLQAIQRLQQAYPVYAHVSMTYAGRLDPMASGLLLILAGEMCKRKDEFTSLDKEYEVDILFGVATDTYDILGIIDAYEPEKGKISRQLLDSTLANYLGTIEQLYPPFSSKPIQGTPLFQHARQGTLDTIIRPKHTITIHSIDSTDIKEITGKSLLGDVTKRIQSVSGDFRQQEALDSWNSHVEPQDSLYIVKLRVSCSSGTYMRQLAYDIGQSIGVPACALHIKRLSVGKYRLT